MTPRSTLEQPLVLAITGASGAVYAVRLLQCLCDAQVPVHLVMSPSASTVIQQELNLDVGLNRNQIDVLLKYCWPDLATQNQWTPRSAEWVRKNMECITIHDYQDYMTPIASGSFLTRGMVICPCSGATISGVVHAAGSNLIQRAADVHLKEHRKLILVPRETPMSVFQLENLHRAAQAGAIVLPATPGWYHDVRSVVDLIDFVVARILDHLQVPNTLMKRWADATGLGPDE
ncbi:MAG TPA: flavin prenyltransferase UbiX [Pirellula sp.]|nr:flavin prenyltransferase UbiX [Pirellula sp.]